MENGFLSIRRFRQEDVNNLFVLLSNIEVMKYLENPYDYDKTVLFLQEAGLAENPLIYAVDINKKEFIGYVIYHPYDEDSYEIGWVINPNFWRRGYANELTKMLIAESKGKTKKLVIECSPLQTVTQKIALKNGFSYIGNIDGLEKYVLEVIK